MPRWIRQVFEVRHSPLVGSGNPALRNIVVRMEAYATDGKRNSVGHGLAGEDWMSSARWCSVLLQELVLLVHVPDIFESMQKLTHALRLGQGMAIMFKY